MALVLVDRYQSPVSKTRALAKVGLLVSLAACIGKDPYAPGESLGSFTVTARLASSTCGQAPDPWAFDVRLRHEQTTLHWVQGGVPISGELDAALSARLTSSTTETVREADAKSGEPGCVLTRTDELDVALAGEGGVAISEPSETMSFSGTLSYRFAPAAGAACWEEVDTGAYAALPCEVRYAIQAVRTAPPR